MRWQIPLNKPYFGSQEKQAVMSVLESGELGGTMAGVMIGFLGWRFMLLTCTGK